MLMKISLQHIQKISEAKIRPIVRLFAVDLDVLQIVHITSLNRNTANRYWAAFCEHGPFP